MKLINDLLRPVFDLLQAPFAGLPAFVGVLVWSIPVGVFALWVFGKTSNQVRIAEVKRRIHAGLFEIRLFNDDLRAIMKAQWQILGHVLHYQALALKPMIFILPPLVLVMVQLHQFYGFRGLRAGDHALMTVQLEPAAEAGGGVRPDIELEVPEGLHVATGPVWVPSLAQISWELAVDTAGDYELPITVGGETATKSLRATDRLIRLSPERPPRTFVGQLEWPSEPPLDGAIIRSVTLGYADGTIGFLGWDFEWSFAWMVVFFVLTMVIALALRKPMGVEL